MMTTATTTVPGLVADKTYVMTRAKARAFLALLNMETVKLPAKGRVLWLSSPDLKPVRIAKEANGGTDFFVTIYGKW